MWLPCGGGSTPPSPHSMKWCMTPSTFPHDQPHVCHATDALHHTSPIAMMPQSTTTRQPHAYHEVLEGQVAHLPLPHLLLLFLPTSFPSHLIPSLPPSSPSSPSHGTNCINVHTCTTDTYVCTFVHMHTVHTYMRRPKYLHSVILPAYSTYTHTTILPRLQQQQQHGASILCSPLLVHIHPLLKQGMMRNVSRAHIH